MGGIFTFGGDFYPHFKTFYFFIYYYTYMFWVPYIGKYKVVKTPPKIPPFCKNPPRVGLKSPFMAPFLPVNIGWEAGKALNDRQLLKYGCVPYEP